MLKILSTQLTGVFQTIQGEEESIEDCARLLAQATVGSGTLYLYATKEMQGVVAEALEGKEPLANAARCPHDLATLTLADRVLLVTRFTNDEESLSIGKALYEKGIPFAVIATNQSDDEPSLVDYADVLIDLKLKRAILPNDTGGRFCYPSSMAALYAYYGVKFVMDEMLAEYTSEND